MGGRYIFFLSVVIITLHKKINIWFVVHNYLVEQKHFQIPSMYILFLPILSDLFVRLWLNNYQLYASDNFYCTQWDCDYCEGKKFQTFFRFPKKTFCGPFSDACVFGRFCVEVWIWLRLLEEMSKCTLKEKSVPKSDKFSKLFFSLIVLYFLCNQCLVLCWNYSLDKNID